MKRRAFAAGAGLLLIAAALPARAQSGADAGAQPAALPPAVANRLNGAEMVPYPGAKPVDIKIPEPPASANAPREKTRNDRRP